MLRPTIPWHAWPWMAFRWHIYQTHCPQMRTFALQWSLHGVYATARAQKYCVSPSPRRFVEEFCQLREKKMEKVERKRKTDRDNYLQLQKLSRYNASKEKKESKMNLRSHFASPKSAQIPTKYISKRGKLIQLFEFGGAFIIPSMRCLPSPVFLDPLLSGPITLLSIYIQSDGEKYKNAPSKSWPNNPSFSPLVA